MMHHYFFGSFVMTDNAGNVSQIFSLNSRGITDNHGTILQNTNDSLRLETAWPFFMHTRVYCCFCLSKRKW